MQALVAEGAGAVRERERHHDEVTWLDVADLGADVLDDADRLVAHRPPGLLPLEGCVRPEIAAADAGADDADDRVGRLLDPRVGDVLDPDVPSRVHDSCSHECLLSAPRKAKDCGA
jgi:hypothetical protein